MKAYSSREIIAILKRDGWELVRVTGSHHQFRHPVKRGTITVPHPRESPPIETVRGILKHAGIEDDRASAEEEGGNGPR